MKAKQIPTIILLCGGLVLLGFGIIATRDLDHVETERILARLPQDLIFFGPAIALLGCLMLLRAFAWSERWLTRRRVLVLGLVMFSISLFVWLFVIATDHGSDASWAKGMLAIMSTIYAGLPGLFLTLASFVLKPAENKMG